MNILDLDEDVLSLVLSDLSIPSLLNLSATCRALTHPAQRQALSSIVFSAPDDIPIICGYILADKSCAQCIRSLEIHSRIYSVNRAPGYLDKHLDATPMPLLAVLLHQASNLKRLVVTCIEPLLTGNPAMGDSIAGLQNLDELYFETTGPLTMQVLSCAQSRPRKLSLSFLNDMDWQGFSCLDLPVLLSAHSLSLYHVAGMDLAPMRPPCASRSYPALRHLSLEWSEHLLSLLPRAFPSVRSLRVRHVDVQSCFAHATIVRWPTLDRLYGSSYGLAFWPAACPVHWLVLEREPPDITFMFDAVSRAAPVALRMQVTIDEQLFTHEYFARLLRATPRLRFLSLFFVGDHGPWPDFKLLA